MYQWERWLADGWVMVPEKSKNNASVKSWRQRLDILHGTATSGRSPRRIWGKEKRHRITITPMLSRKRTPNLKLRLINEV